MRKLTNYEATINDDSTEINLPVGEVRFIELNDGVLSRPKIVIAIEHDTDADVRSCHLELVDLEADQEDNFVFAGTVPSGTILDARIHGGMRRNHLQLIVEIDGGQQVERSFLFVADDAEVPEAARFVSADRPRDTAGAWVIYETSARV